MTDPTTAYSQPLVQERHEPTASERPRGSSFRPEEPRRHPVAYLALALSLISLLWLAIWSSLSGGDVYQKVRVGTQDCVSVPQDNGPAALYCRTTGPVK